MTCLPLFSRGRYTISLLTLALLVGSFSSTAQAQGRRNPQSEYLKTNGKFLQIFREIIAGPRESTVSIRVDGKEVALGTIVSADGLILTKASQLADNAVAKLPTGNDLELQVLGRNDDHDLALVKVEASGLKPVEFRPSKEAPVGSWAISVGTDQTPVALGVVSVAMRDLKFPKNFRPTPPSTSGYLGVSLDPSVDEAKIKEVMPKTAASDAGIKVNDTIVAIAGKKISDANSLIQTLQTFRAGQSVKVRIRRGDEELELQAKLGKRPASRGDIQNNMGSRLSDRRTGFPTILQHDSVVLPEQCGGPLVDLDGKVIGINISRAGRTESYAIPTEVILPLIDALKNANNTSNVKEPSK